MHRFSVATHVLRRPNRTVCISIMFIKTTVTEYVSEPGNDALLFQSHERHLVCLTQRHTTMDCTLLLRACSVRYECHHYCDTQLCDVSVITAVIHNYIQSNLL
jgi:hypothetical protein